MCQPDVSHRGMAYLLYILVASEHQNSTWWKRWIGNLSERGLLRWKCLWPTSLKVPPLVAGALPDSGCVLLAPPAPMLVDLLAERKGKREGCSCLWTAGSETVSELAQTREVGNARANELTSSASAWALLQMG